ncbi:DUF1771-domain-containing protein [Hesseltinella vesiculosa]|uniref:DUF1771-domain-containing protein n=1 Tax=Hesseltinella vesiculosa TaxID=101127 RepID=A0A1X2GMB0_9FUNG|nr:DUF1771-domain-containing protein [Hesseltinella vesiculosa]
MGNSQSLSSNVKQGIQIIQEIKKAKDQFDQQQQQGQGGNQQHGGGYQQQHGQGGHQQGQGGYQQPQPHQGSYQPPQQQGHQQQGHQQQGYQQQPHSNFTPSPSHDYGKVQQEHDDPEYTRLRSMAHDEAEKRNACYDRSQAAYQQGDGARAKEESNQGHEHDRLMKQYNQQAADLAYNQKNAGRAPNEIDLHGLFVAEASDRVEEALQRCQREGYKDLTIIVGKGLHSPDHIAKLKPAITELVKKYQVRCEVGRPNPGCLYVEFGKGTGDMSWLDRVTDTLNKNQTCLIM